MSKMSRGLATVLVAVVLAMTMSVIGTQTEAADSATGQSEAAQGQEQP